VNNNRGEGSRIQGEIDLLQNQFLQLDSQQDIFDSLKEDGFFEPQGRREAERVLRDIQNESGVVSAKVGISAATIDKNEIAREAGYSVLSSPVSIAIQAIDDVAVYRYISMLRNDFPGYLNIDRFELNRTGDVDAVFLRNITLDEGAPPIEAKLEMIWRTMVPDDVAGFDPAQEGLF